MGFNQSIDLIPNTGTSTQPPTPAYEHERNLLGMRIGIDVPIAMTASAAATALGVDRGTILDLIKSGDLAARRLGKRWLIPAQALRDYLEGCFTAQQARKQAQ